MSEEGGGWKTRFTHLECFSCGKNYRPRPINVCTCGKPLLARYDLRNLERDELLGRRDLWRYAPLLPVAKGENMVTLGEGGTPLTRAEKLPGILGVKEVFVKDEGVNPTGTFKARGMAVAVSKAKELGLTKLAVATTGSAGSGLSAYAREAGLTAFIAFAKGTSPVHIRTSKSYGAEIKICKGFMPDAIAAVQKLCDDEGYFNIATMREPYRVEGKKTITMEIAEELGDLPNAIVFPVGGGTGIVAGWKAWLEMKELGWVENDPRLYFVQAQGCAPVYAAWRDGKDKCEMWPDVRTKAHGLAIPKPFADELILRSVKETKGGGVAVSDEEMIVSMKEFAEQEGISACIEGAATLAGAKELVKQGLIRSDDRVVLVNTGIGRTRIPRPASSP